MYLSIPDVFLVPVRYFEEDILNLKKIAILQDCNSDNDFINATIKRKELVIGLSLPSENQAIWISEKDDMEKHAKLYNATLKVENADDDIAKQSLQVDNLISQGIDILILAPVDSIAAAPIVEKVHKAGLKVVNFDRLIMNSDLDIYISFNSIGVGELQGRFITNQVPKGNYIIMSGDPRDNNAKLFKEGAMEYIKPLVDTRAIKIVTDQPVINWDPKNAFKIVHDSLIVNNNKIDAILAPNDGTAGGAIQALAEQGLAGKIPVVGQDGDLAAFQRIAQGTQLMTVVKDTKELGNAAMDAAVRLARGQALDINGSVNNGKIDVPSIFIPPTAVDKNNLDGFLEKTGYFKKEDVYKM